MLPTLTKPSTHSTAMGNEKARIHGMNLPPLVALREIHGTVLLGEAAAQIAQRIADFVLHGEGADGLFLVH